MQIEKIQVTRFDNDLATKTLEAINKINEVVEVINAITIDVDGTKCVDGSKKLDTGELAYLQKENSDLKDEVERTRKALELAITELKNCKTRDHIGAVCRTPEYVDKILEQITATLENQNGNC